MSEEQHAAEYAARRILEVTSTTRASSFDKTLAELDRIAKELDTMRKENASASKRAERISWIQTILSVVVGFVLGKFSQYIGF